MKVAFDLRGLQGVPAVKAHGGGEYTRTIVQRLTADGLAKRTAFIVDSSRSLSGYAESVLDHAGEQPVAVASPAELSRALPSSVDTYYSPLPYRYSDLPDVPRRFITIHGIRPLELPTDTHEWRYRHPRELPIVLAKRLLPRWYKDRQHSKFERFINQDVRLIVPSEHTRFSLVREFPQLDPASVLVFYSPPTPVSQTQPAPIDVLGQYGLEHGRFLLLVSGGRFEKNSYRALSALANLRRRHGDVLRHYKVAIVGGCPRVVGQSMKRDLVVMPYVDDPTLARLYASARLFVYPTLNEGFGYPPLESLAHGTPVAAAAVCSLPEVLDGCGVRFFDPRNVAEIESRILWALQAESAAHGESALERHLAVVEKQTHALTALVATVWGKT